MNHSLGAFGTLSLLFLLSQTAFPSDLATFPGDLKLVVLACDKNACPLELQLRSNDGAVLDTSPLRFPAAPGPTETDHPDQSNASIVYAPTLAAAQRIWSWGSEESSVSLSALPVHLTRSRMALLIDQSAGFQSVQHWQAIYTSEKGRLKIVWQHEPSPGPSWSEVHVISSADGSSRFLAVDGLTLGTEAGPDQLHFEVLSWSEKHQTLQPIARPASEFLAVGKSASSLGQARQWQRDHACLVNTLVLPGVNVVTASPAAFYLVRLAMTRTAASAISLTFAKPACAHALTKSGPFSVFRLKSTGDLGK